MDDQLISGYWSEVHRHLIDDCGVEPASASEGVARYREQLRDVGVGKLIYNQPASRTAKAVSEMLRETQHAE
jgi:hypothetical protein